MSVSLLQATQHHRPPLPIPHQRTRGGPALLPPKIRMYPRVLKLQSKEKPRERLSPLLTPRVRPGVYHGNPGTVTSLRVPPEPQHPHHLHQVCGDRGAQPCQALLCCLLPASASSHGAIAAAPLVMPAGGSLCAIPVLPACLECCATVPVPGHGHGVATRQEHRTHEGALQVGGCVSINKPDRW